MFTAILDTGLERAETSGLDIGAPVGTPVKAPAPGIVVFAGVHAEYGQTLIVDHGHDTKSIYGHLSKLTVALNEKVQRLA